MSELADPGLSAVCLRGDGGPGTGERPARSREVTGGAEADPAEAGQQDRSQEE